MGVEELHKKLKSIQQEKKLSEQAVKRLKERVNKLLLHKSEGLQSEISDDFVKIMNDNTDKMTAIEKQFWEQQSLALSKRGASKTMRWHPSMIRLALQLRMISPVAYDFVKGVLSLPSERRLFDYSQFTEIQEGVQEEILQQFHKLIELKCLEEHQKYFNLVFDEMNIRSDRVFNSRSGELVGFTNLSSVEEELAVLKSEIQGQNYEKKLAKKVLLFMLHGCTNELRFVPEMYSTDDLSSAQLFMRTCDVIYAVEEAGAVVFAVIVDGASVNRKFINMHSNFGDSDFIHATNNIVAGESRPLYFMVDPPHLLKTFRNYFANSFCHRKSRALYNNDQQISWKAVQVLFEMSRTEKFKCTKLTKAHVFLNSFSCMKVSLAAQVLSDSVARALQKYKDSPLLKDHYIEELVNFIVKLNKWFDCLNSSVDSKKKVHNVNLCEYNSVNDAPFTWLKDEFIDYLKEWYNYVMTREGRYSKDQRSRMIISHQSLEAIKITVYSFVAVAKFLLMKDAPFVSARNFNQDPVEQYFSDLRSDQGADNNPTLKQVLHSRLSYHAVGQMTKGGKTGSTEDLRKMEVDASPLPVRKKHKK